MPNSEREFRAWKARIPPRSINSSLHTVANRSLRGRLASFFQEARRLIDIDASVLQQVIQSLAGEDGLRCVQELVEQDFGSMTASMKRNVFELQALPFLETISHHDVLSSLVLEQAVGTIYNVLFGMGGARAAVFLGFISDVLATTNTDETGIRWLEVSLLVFSRIVDLNSTASVQVHIQTLAKRFEGILMSMDSPDRTGTLHDARVYLERLLRRLDIGSSLPTAVSRKEIDKPLGTTFITAREGPGGRHNNDHEDFYHIRIMPSLEEISSSRAEYLPVTDPTQWHVNGINGLLDRNFRLLREDTVGQLRDTIFEEMNGSNRRRSPKSPLRKNVYHGATMVNLTLEWFAGLQIEIEFPQPAQVKQRSSARDREIWWQISKRLQSGALVCLIIKQRFVVFCTVAQRKMPSKEKDNKATQQEQESSSLWKDSSKASVKLEMVDSTPRSIQLVVDQYSVRKAELSLVEFPGVLLPAFQPTLKALQSIKANDNLPFSDLLVPADANQDQAGPIEVRPPSYTTKPGFAFNLRCLTTSHADLLVRHNQPFNLQKLQDDSSLDNAQAAALVNCLQRQIGLIQGPPGTGKSYTGVALIKVLLASKQRNRTELGPIICVTYTNHALDQLLEALLDNQVTSQIVRIGSRSKSARLGAFNLQNIAKDAEKTKVERRSQWESRGYLEDCEKNFSMLRLGRDSPGAALESHLMVQHLHHYEQLFGKDEDGFQKNKTDNPRRTINAWLRSDKSTNAAPRPLEELEEVNVFAMSREERHLIHAHWNREIQDQLSQEVTRLVLAHAKDKTDFENVRDELHLRCLSKADVIGVTTSGLAGKLNMLRRLRCKALLCEEAGEVLESHLLTAFLPSIEHAILIGDHLQLPPQVQNYELSRENPRGGTQYALDVSLFERLVDPGRRSPMGCGLPLSTLTTQRRMHPSIAQLVHDTLYPQLEDAPLVSEYPEVVGMKRRLFWMDHRMPEADSSSTDALSTSHWNHFEIDMTVALVRHLVQQGKYRSRDIAVLTPYLGQLHKMRQRLSESFAIVLGEGDLDQLEHAGYEEDADKNKSVVRTRILDNLRVATVDNFQGEEAKVVVISLVRSNAQNRCGFLRSSNRINVLLSRAQHGMYIIGNSQTSIGVPMWAKVVDILKQSNNIGEVLELQCPRHPDTPIAITKPDDFPRLSPEGGCDLRCVKRLACGHACVQKCHSDLLHNAVFCLEPCPKPRQGCTHPCPKRCGDQCPDRCCVNVWQDDRMLKCGHVMQNLPCWQDQDLSTVLCPVLVEKVVPGCTHVVQVACHVDVTSVHYQCVSSCRAPLSCGHACKGQCYECTTRTSPDTIESHHIVCKQPCGRQHSTCAHTCAAHCHGDNPCPPCEAPCDVQCAHSKCALRCHEPCIPCAEERCPSACPHSACSMPCAAPCDHIPCSTRCSKILACGHQCPSVCGEKCPSEQYCQICGGDEVLSHEVDFILGQMYEEINLDENPCIFPTCGHFLTMESMDAQMNLKQHYVVDAEEKPIALINSSNPFSIDDIKTCAICRGPLRNLARYGRLVRRALLDESTKKLILFLNREYVPLAEKLPQLIQELHDAPKKVRYEWPENVKIEGSRNSQVKLMGHIVRQVQPHRWDAILNLHRRIEKYHKSVTPKEQPFQKVRDMVESARRRQKTEGRLEFDSHILQTKGDLQSTALSLRLYISLLADFISLANRVAGGEGPIQMDLQRSRDDSERLIRGAATSNHLSTQVEGHVFLAQLYALEQAHPPSSESSEALVDRARTSILEARRLCDEFPGQTQGLTEEIDNAEKMVNGGTFYAAVTSEERIAVLRAMAREFRGTGHWYYCRNNHPFTIGECGGAMQRSSCPQCGAPIGGQNHQAAEGVTRADDLERALREVRL